MEQPELVQSRLDGERVLARVELGGDDAVLVTPTRTLVYRAEGLLSDESVSAYPHDADRVELRSGRRKTTFRLVYVDGAKDFTVPSKRTHEVLVPVLAGVLRTAGVIEADESVRGAYRFSELTLVVTDRRVVKHVGNAVWDEEFEVAPYADLSGLSFQEGSVATEVSLVVDGYPQRVKVPNEHAGTVRRTVQEAAFEFHGVSSLAELEAALGDEAEAEDADEDGGGESEGDALEESGFATLLDDGEAESDDAGDGGGSGRAGAEGGTTTATEGGGTGTSEASEASGADTDPFGTEEGGGTILDPVGRDTAADGTASGGGTTAGAAGSTGGPEGADTDGPAGPADATPGDPDVSGPGEPPAGEVPPAVLERLEELTAAVERQNERLEHQGKVIRRLVEELRQGR